MRHNRRFLIAFLIIAALACFSVARSQQGISLGTSATAGHYLRGNGNAYVDSAIVSGDVPVGGNVASIMSCGTSAACSPTTATNAQIVFGSVVLSSGTPSTAAVTGISPAFTGAGTYVCTIAGQSGAATGLYSVANVSGSAFTITGPNTNTTTMNYICVGK